MSADKPSLSDEIRALLDQARRGNGASALHVTTMRFPARTMEIIDANRGTMNRTQYIIFLVDQIGNTALGAEIDRCADENTICERA